MFERIKDELRWAKDSAFFEGFEFNRWEFFCYIVRQLFNEEVCRIKGHQWHDDEGYAGPDSGCMDHTCERCGLNHHVTLY